MQIEWTDRCGTTRLRLPPWKFLHGLEVYHQEMGPGRLGKGQHPQTVHHEMYKPVQSVPRRLRKKWKLCRSHQALQEAM